MGHEGTGHDLTSELDTDAVRSVAATPQALAHPGRLRILATLQTGRTTVGDLTEALGLEQSTISHQLPHLREQGFVTAERHGRHIEYWLYDDPTGERVEAAVVESPAASVRASAR